MLTVSPKVLFCIAIFQVSLILAVDPLDRKVKTKFSSVLTRGASKQFQNNNKSGFTELSFSRVPKTGIRNEKEIKVLISPIWEWGSNSPP